MVETIQILAYVIVAMVGSFMGFFVSSMVKKFKNYKYKRNFSHEKVFKKLTEDGKVYYDQPKTNGPARKIIYSLEPDPKTGKKILTLKYEDFVEPKEEKVKKKPKKSRKNKEDPKEEPQEEVLEIPTNKAPNYGKVLGTPKSPEEEE